MTLDIKKLPDYNSKEELINSISHFIGFGFGVMIFLYFLVTNIFGEVSFCSMFPYYYYSFFMCFMFFTSGFYHSRKPSSLSRAIARTIDHCDIYVFIAATYLPICIYGISNSFVSILLIVLEHIFAIVGVLMNALPIESKKGNIISYICYILEGWALIFVMPFNVGISLNVFLWILAGGILFTIGAILYAIGRKKRYYHSLFHIFVLLGVIVQFVGILNTIPF